MSSLASYENDLSEWIGQQIIYLKQGQYDKIDMENFIDEVEGVVRTEKRSMRSYFVVLIAHMLKHKYQPEKATRSWYSSIDCSRREINEILKDSPSLKNHLPTAFEEAWIPALKIAYDETGLRKGSIPSSCPWDVDYVMKKVFNVSEFKGSW